MFFGIIAFVGAIFFFVFVLRILGMPIYAAQQFRQGNPVMGWSMAIVSLGILWMVYDIVSTFMH